MSKKLIAVASATALALAALVGAPASAATFAVQVTENVGGTGSAADPYTINVPTQNVVRGQTAAESAGGISASSAIKIEVTSSLATNTTSATATGAVKLVTTADEEADNKPATTGATTFSAVGATVTFYATNTSTTTGTVTISEGGNIRVIHIKGVSTGGYNLKVTGSASAAQGGSYKMVATVTDMFGNPTTGLNADSFNTSGSGSVATAIAETVAATSTTSGVYNITAPVGSIVSAGPGLITLTLVKPMTEVTAFGDLTDSATLVVNSADPAAALETAQAQVAALTAQLANSRSKATSVTKKRFNTLARAWNRAFPSQAVKLKR